MMRFFRGAAALVTLSALMAAPSMAQFGGGANNLMIKGGIFNPTKGDTKAVGNNWWAYGAEYQFGNFDAKTVNSVELLYANKNGAVSSPGLTDVPTRFSAYSLMLNHKIRSVGSDGVALGQVFFYGGGLGLDIVRVKVNDLNPGGEGVIDKHRTAGAANLFAGYEVSANFQVEAKYIFPVGKVQGRKMDGWFLLAGVKF